jgi:hypothetical protein
LTQAEIATIVGVSPGSISRWKNKGPLNNAHFTQAIIRGQARGMERRLARIEAASSTQWQAAAWLLERQHPERFGRYRVEHVGEGGGPVQVEGQFTVNLTGAEVPKPKPGQPAKPDGGEEVA